MIDVPERSAERDRAIRAMLPHVPFDGWTMRALRAGLSDLGEPPQLAPNLFPDGPLGLVEAWSDLADRDMESEAAGLAEPRLGRRVRAVIALRLRALGGHREAVRRALAVLARSADPAAASRITARTIDAIWHAAGDRSADFSWYTKRATLAAVYGSTLLYWLNDRSDEGEATLAFLDRRLAGVAAFGRLRRRLADRRARFSCRRGPGSSGREAA